MKENSKMKKIALVAVMALALFVTGCSKEDKEALENAKLPIAEQPVVEIIKNKKDEESDSYTEEEISAIVKNPMFEHLSNDDGSYINVLKNGYGKNMLFQEVYDNEGKNIQLGSAVKNQKLPTVVVFTRVNCPYCEVLHDKLAKTYSQDVYNLIFAEGYMSDEQDVKEDIDAVKDYLASVKDTRFFDNYIFGTDGIMDDLHCEYYPTIVFLNSDGYIVNVSHGTDDNAIKKVFEKTSEELKEK